MPSLGEEFRAAREARGLSLSDVAERIHIRSTYLQSIENETWSDIGESVYVRGFLRTYARFLGIDPESAIERFNASVPSAPPTKQFGAPPPVQRRSDGPSPWLWIAVVVALGLVGYVGWGYYQLRTATPVAVASGTPAPTATSALEAATPAPGVSSSAGDAEPSVSPVASASPAPGREGLNLRLSQRSWIRVTVDGTVVLEGIFPAGTARTFIGKRVLVRAGNAGGVDVALGGAPFAPLGAAGSVVERTYAVPAPNSER